MLVDYLLSRLLFPATYLSCPVSDMVYCQSVSTHAPFVSSTPSPVVLLNVTSMITLLTMPLLVLTLLRADRYLLYLIRWRSS